MGALHKGENPHFKWRLIGSSMGAYIATIWASRKGNKDKVDKLVLLSPTFNMSSRWNEMLEKVEIQKWKETNEFYYPGKGEIHYQFYKDCVSTEPYPTPQHPALIIHAIGDRKAPLECIDKYIAKAPASIKIKIIEAKDKHGLRN